jgi:hypothetical protein
MRWLGLLIGLAVAGAVLASTAAVAGDTYVRGYYRNNGTYVQPHMRSAPDDDRLNNWSTKGNVNPYTGQGGTKDPYSQGYGTGSGSGLGMPYQGYRPYDGGSGSRSLLNDDD